MTTKNKNNPLMTAAGIAGLVLTLAGQNPALSTPRAAAAPLVRAQTSADPADTAVTGSQLTDIRLPGGASRVTDAGDMAKFRDALGQVARAHKGKIARCEVLGWAGGDAKAAKDALPAALKGSGYLVTLVDAFDSETGRVTPFAAARPGETSRLIGLWIETKEDVSLLVWGRFEPDAAPASPAAAKTVVSLAAPKPAKTKPAAKKVAEKSKKPAAAATGESDAQRRAKAIKAYQDYQYVKLMGPISGSMYRSSKW